MQTTTTEKTTAPPIQMKDVTTEIEQHGREVNARMDRAFKCIDQAENLMRSAGSMIVDAKRNLCPRWDISMTDYLRITGVSKTQANRCLQIYFEKKTIEDIRQETREGMRRHRAKKQGAQTKRTSREDRKSSTRPNKEAPERASQTRLKEDPSRTEVTLRVRKQLDDMKLVHSDPRKRFDALVELVVDLEMRLAKLSS